MHRAFLLRREQISTVSAGLCPTRGYQLRLLKKSLPIDSLQNQESNLRDIAQYRPFIPVSLITHVQKIVICSNHDNYMREISLQLEVLGEG